MIGCVVGNYQVVEKVGEGGMGTVYRGIDMMIEREVAIKALRSELTNNPELAERFRHEAVTLAKLNHPNIATLYTFFRQGNEFFMVMEFVRGETLDNSLRRAGAMPTENAVTLFCQALDGIGHAHSLGIIHRDIKPANMMLAEGGILKVMDFGIARILGGARLTRTGSFIGTLGYMSPEQIQGNETDAKSDIYSLGVLLYEMLTGKLPFQCNNEFELMKSHIESLPPHPASLAPQIGLELDSAIMKALSKSASDRFQSALEFKEVLLSVINSSTNLWNNREEGQGKPVAAVRNFSKALSRMLELESILQTAVEEIGIALDAHRVTLTLWEEGSNKSESISVYERSGVSGEMSEAASDGIPITRYALPLRLETPITYRNSTIGVLVIEDDAPERKWSDDEIAAVTSISDQLGVAISHARLFRRVQIQAITDKATGLYNDRYFEDRLRREIELADKNGQPVSLILLDIDFLSQIKSEKGRAGVDSALRHAAQIVRSSARDVDICAKCGADVFVILPQCGREDALRAAERMREAIAATPVEGVGQMSVSCGVSTYPTGAQSKDELLETAERAALIAKEAGRNRVRALMPKN